MLPAVNQLGEQHLQLVLLLGRKGHKKITADFLMMQCVATNTEQTLQGIFVGAAVGSMIAVAMASKLRRCSIGVFFAGKEGPSAITAERVGRTMIGALGASYCLILHNNSLLQQMLSIHLQTSPGF